MDKRSRDSDSVTTFTNQGFCGDNNMGERKIDQPLNPSRLCNYGNGLLARNGRSAHDRPNDQNSMPISECLRQFALEGHARTSERQHSRNIRKPKQTKYHNGCIIFLTIVLVLAPITISVYVFLKHELIVSSPCSSHSVGPSITPSMQQSNAKYSELKKLINEVKELQNKYQKLRTQSGDKSSETSVRDQRRARQNCSSDSSGYQASLDKLRKRLTRKGNGIERSCVFKIKELNSKIDDISRKLNEETSNCIFKMENNTEVDNVKNIQKVQINENKNAAVQLVGVTCCSEYNTSNVSNAILEVKETISNITYACYCAVGQKCNICYWQCADTSRHQVK